MATAKKEQQEPERLPDATADDDWAAARKAAEAHAAERDKELTDKAKADEKKDK